MIHYQTSDQTTGYDIVKFHKHADHFYGADVTIKIFYKLIILVDYPRYFVHT
jgi:hypothetical protein